MSEEVLTHEFNFNFFSSKLNIEYHKYEINVLKNYFSFIIFFKILNNMFSQFTLRAHFGGGIFL